MTGVAAGLLVVLAAAASAQTVSLEGRVAHPRTLTAADLQRAPTTSVTVSYDTEHGPQHGSYTGELLWTLIDGAGLIDEPGKRTRLQHVVLARGHDGYAVALALGEFDPGFEGKQVIVAYEQDGKPLPGLKLVVPNDRKGGRSVHDLATLEVR